MNASRILIVGASLVAGVSAATMACGSPEMYCTSAYGDYAVSLELADTNDPEGECATLVGETAHLDTYADKLDESTADWSQGNLVITTYKMNEFQTIAADWGIVDPNEQRWSRAEFVNSKPNDGFCPVDVQSNAVIDLPEVPAEEERGVASAGVDWEELFRGDDDDSTGTGEDSGTGETGGGDDDDDDDDDDTGEPPFPGQEPIQMEVEWSDMTIYATPDAQGTQFEAKMKVTINDCVATYDAVGLYPVVGCETDEECEDPASGINPSFDVKCDTDAGTCTLAKAMPSYE
ncbi:MAG: hypothetical protein B7733_20830 [Myxococcales bacterium FL481]|nr:MAG: hypothetical protein B7733_20830 [Myxococcales bacterium FL481]